MKERTLKWGWLIPQISSWIGRNKDRVGLGPQESSQNKGCKLPTKWDEPGSMLQAIFFIWISLDGSFKLLGT